MVIDPWFKDQNRSLSATHSSSSSTTPSDKCTTEFDHKLQVYMNAHKNTAGMLTTGEHGYRNVVG